MFLLERFVLAFVGLGVYSPGCRLLFMRSCLSGIAAVTYTVGTGDKTETTIAEAVTVVAVQLIVSVGFNAVTVKVCHSHADVAPALNIEVAEASVRRVMPVGDAEANTVIAVPVMYELIRISWPIDTPPIVTVPVSDDDNVMGPVLSCVATGPKIASLSSAPTPTRTPVAWKPPGGDCGVIRVTSYSAQSLPHGTAVPSTVQRKKLPAS